MGLNICEDTDLGGELQRVKTISPKCPGRKVICHSILLFQNEKIKVGIKYLMWLISLAVESERPSFDPKVTTHTLINCRELNFFYKTGMQYII